MYAAVQSWTSINPDYDYYFFNKDERRALIEEYFDARVLKAYDKLELGALRADLWRYCGLFLHGGVYADIDFVSLVPLREVLQSHDEFVTANAHAPAQALVNGFIAAIPQHPFLEAAIHRAVDNVLSDARKQPMALTGPLCFGEAVNVVLGRDPSTRFDDGDHVHNNISFRLLSKVHAKEQHRHRVVDGSRTIFMCKYADYEDDLRAFGLEHWQASIARERRGHLSHWFGAMVRRIRRLGRKLLPLRTRADGRRSDPS